jgi:hypothetical protein
MKEKSIIFYVWASTPRASASKMQRIPSSRNKLRCHVKKKFYWKRKQNEETDFSNSNSVYSVNQKELDCRTIFLMLSGTTVRFSPFASLILALEMLLLLLLLFSL